MTVRAKTFKRVLAVICAVLVCLGACCILSACSDETVEEQYVKYTNVPYAENPTSYQYLDITVPAQGEGPYPLIVFVHGGSWIGLSRNYGIFNTMFSRLLDNGYAVAYVDYTLSSVSPVSSTQSGSSEDGTDGETEAESGTEKKSNLWGSLELSVVSQSGFPQMIYDLKAAIRFLRANASEYQIDPDNFVLLGESAGAHIAMLCEATDGNSEYEDLSMGNAGVSSSVSGVITVCCPTLYDITEDATQACLNYIIGSSYTEEQFEEASPYCQVTDKMCPVFMAHGMADTTIPYEHTVKLAEKLTGLIGEDNVMTWYPEGVEHVDKTVFNSKEFTALVETFLEKVTG